MVSLASHEMLSPHQPSIETFPAPPILDLKALRSPSTATTFAPPPSTQHDHQSLDHLPLEPSITPSLAAAERRRSSITLSPSVQYPSQLNEPKPFGLKLAISEAESVESAQSNDIQIIGLPEQTTDQSANQDDNPPIKSAFKFNLSMAGISVEEDYPMINLSTDSPNEPIIEILKSNNQSVSLSINLSNGVDLERKTAAKLSAASLLGVDQSFNLKRASYEVTNEGILKTDLFHIGKTGFARSSIDDGSIKPSLTQPKRAHLDISEDSLIELSLLGRGAGGKVLKAFHKPSLTIVALKCIDVSDKVKRAQLLKELKELDTEYCPYIVAFYGAYYVDTTFTVKLGLEVMNRGSFQAVIHEIGAVSELALTHAMKQVLLGLNHLHKNKKLHRDIKPGNILINHFGVCKLSDFGIIAELASSMAKCGTFVGTMVYMSPERLTSEAYSYPADVWSLGLSVIAMATGKYPLNIEDGYWGLVMHFNTQPSPTLPENGDFSPQFRDFVSRCLEKEPAKRWTIPELLEHPWIQNGCEAEESLTYWPAKAKMFEPDPVIVKQQKAARLEKLRKLEELDAKRKMKVTSRQARSKPSVDWSNRNAEASNENSHARMPSINSIEMSPQARQSAHHQHRRKQAITKFHPVGLAHLQAEATQQILAQPAKSKSLYDDDDDSDEEANKQSNNQSKAPPRITGAGLPRLHTPTILSSIQTSSTLPPLGKVDELARSRGSSEDKKLEPIQASTDSFQPQISLLANPSSHQTSGLSPIIAPLSTNQNQTISTGRRVKQLHQAASSASYLAASGPRSAARSHQPSVDFNLGSPSRMNRYAQLKVINGQMSVLNPLTVSESNHSPILQPIPDRASPDSLASLPSISLGARQGVRAHRRSPTAAVLASSSASVAPFDSCHSAQPMMRSRNESRRPSVIARQMKLPSITINTPLSEQCQTPVSASPVSSDTPKFLREAPHADSPLNRVHPSPPLRALISHRSSISSASGSISSSFTLSDLPPVTPAHFMLSHTPRLAASFELFSPVPLSPRAQRDLALMGHDEREDLNKILDSVCQVYKSRMLAQPMITLSPVDLSPTSEVLESPQSWLPDEAAILEDLERIADQIGVRVTAVAETFRKIWNM